MTGEGMKQVKSLINVINKLEASWQLEMDKWSDNPIGEMPNLAKMVEDRLNHLRGLDAKAAQQFEWMMIL